MSKSDHRAIQTLHALLQERFPLAFPKHYDDLRPIKLGILTNLITRLPDVDPTALRRALANHIEWKNREVKAVRKTEHKRVQRAIKARKAALIAQGVTPELRVERKRRLARETVDQAACGSHGSIVSRDTKSGRGQNRSGPFPTQPRPQEPGAATPNRPPTSSDGRPEQLPDQVGTPSS